MYQALKDDIAAHGIHDALLVTPDLLLITGHHRAKIAVELGLATVPIEIQDVDTDEAERLLIADNVLRRQLNPMEQARLIQRLKKEYDVKRGNNQVGGGGSVKMTEALEPLGVGQETAKRLDRLNKLIPPLQALVSSGQLGTSHGAALASWRSIYEAPSLRRWGFFTYYVFNEGVMVMWRAPKPRKTLGEIQRTLRNIALRLALPAGIMAGVGVVAGVRVEMLLGGMGLWIAAWWMGWIAIDQMS